MKKRFGYAFLGLTGFLTLLGVVSNQKLFAITAHNDFTSFWTIKGVGTLINTAIAWIDNSTRSFNLYDGDIYFGGKGNKPSTTSGEYPGLKVPIKNCGSASWAQGNLVVVNDDEAGCGTLASALDRTDWIGIAEGTTAAGSVGYVTVGGYALALTTGTVNRGDTLVSTNPISGLTGYLGSDTTPTTGADVGVAMSSGTSSGGLTVIRLR
jgi:hypothetical protein